MINKHSNKNEILTQAEFLHGKTLRDIIDKDKIDEVEKFVISKQGNNWSNKMDLNINDGKSSLLSHMFALLGAMVFTIHTLILDAVIWPFLYF